MSKTIIILGKEINPHCSMDEFQEKAEKLGLGDGVATSGYSMHSNLRYGDYWHEGEYHVVGDYHGKKVQMIIYRKALKWGMERKTELEEAIERQERLLTSMNRERNVIFSEFCRIINPDPLPFDKRLLPYGW